MKAQRNLGKNERILLYIRVAMEALWLAVVVGVPLAFASPDSMISYVQLPKLILLRILVGLLAVLWAVEYALTTNMQGGWWRNLGWKSAKSWIAEHPTRWVLVGAGLFMVVYIISTLASTNVSASLWGNSRVWDGYSLYNVIIYFVLFIVIATHLKTKEQLWRLLTGIVLAGGVASLLSVLERLGWIPLGMTVASGNRVQSTFGNPIFFGSFLLMTVPVTLGLLMITNRRFTGNRWIAAWVLLIAIQLLGMAMTVSRGPIIGLVFSLVAFFVLGFLVLKGRGILRPLIVVGIAIGLPLGIFGLMLASGSSITGKTTAKALERRLTSLYPQVASGGFGSRFSIWQASGRLVADRPWFPSESLSLSPIRPLMGYGPESFGYIFPVEAESKSGAQLHAHNALIHQMVEVGYLGFIAALIFLGSILLSLFWLMRKSRSDSDVDLGFKVVTITLCSIIAGRILEQMVGVARVSDLTLFWVLLGVLVSVPTVYGIRQTESPDMVQRRVPSVAAIVPRLALVAVILAVSIWLALAKNVNYFQADVAAANGYSELDINDAVLAMDKAVELAPDVPHYYRYRADMLKQHISSKDDLNYRAQIAEQIYVDSITAVEIEPLAVESVLGLANAAQDLNRLGYEGKGQEAIEAYQKALSMVPHLGEFRARLQILLAIAYVDSQQPEMGLATLVEAFRNAPDKQLKATAFYVQGAAYVELKDVQHAITSLQNSLALEGEPHVAAQAHFLLADLYEEMGDTSLSREHRLQYEQLAQPSDG